MFITSLKNQQEFELVNQLGKKLHEKHFILVLAKKFSRVFSQEQNKNTIFLGMKVSKKLAKKAVIRNKIKRRVKHLVRLVINHSNFKMNLAIIIIPRKGFDKINFSILNQEFSKVISQNL